MTSCNFVNCAWDFEAAAYPRIDRSASHCPNHYLCEVHEVRVPACPRENIKVREAARRLIVWSPVSHRERIDRGCVEAVAGARNKENLVSSL